MEQESTELAYFDWPQAIAEATETQLSDEKLQRGLFTEHVTLYQITENLTASIYLRAQKAFSSYMSTYLENINSENRTNLRPVVRWQEGRTVQLLWVKKIVKTQKATSKDMQVYGKTGVAKNGVLKRVVIRNNEAVLVQEVFKYIKKDFTYNYSSRIFDSEPLWVQIKGKQVEDLFSLLRRELELIQEIRTTAKSLLTLHGKTFRDDTTETGTFDFITIGKPKDCVIPMARHITKHKLKDTKK